MEAISLSNNKKNAKKKETNISFDTIYRQIYIFGAQIMRQTKRILRFFKHWLARPFYFLMAFLNFLWTTLVYFIKKSTTSFTNEINHLKKDFRRLKNQKSVKKIETQKTQRRTFKEYITLLRTRHTRLVKRMVALSIPLAAFILVIVTINFWSSQVFALEIFYNDQSLGYVADEATLLSAQTKANERLSLTAYGEKTAASQSTDNAVQKTEDEEKIEALTGNTSESESKSETTKSQISVQNADTAKPRYKIKLVDKTKLSNDTALADALIDSSNENITNAVGIYINQEFICAVKNETDAISVFDKILEEKKPKDGEGIVDFVEQVDYVHGLYPDSEGIMWDAEKLNTKLRSSKSEAVHHTIASGETVSSIAAKYNTTSAELQALNAGLTEETIRADDTILVAAKVNFLRVKIMKTEIREVKIPYETVKTNSSQLYKGSERLTRDGEEGIEHIVETVSYIDGKRVNVKEVSRTIIKDPVSRQVLVGTKATSIYAPTSYGGPATSGGFVWPVIGARTISNDYATYSWGYTGGIHKGIDIIGSGVYGKSVVAASSGRVTQAYGGSGNNSGYGQCIVIDHGGGLITMYAHLSSVNVSVGQQVYAGQGIGRVGNSGNSTGPHLHFEVRVYGSHRNPRPYLGI